MKPDLWKLYRLMYSSRLFEEGVQRLWEKGLISGEMHLGTGEEAVTAGVMDHVKEGDALALDHRGTSALFMRGIDPVLLVKEFLGQPGGLCGGMGGHMHLFSPEFLAASSGIVGASGPAAVGFAISASRLRSGSIAVAFFGEGAMNQGMLMESMNLAAVWELPVLFVCKNNDWAITTQSQDVTRGDLLERARGLGLISKEVEGSSVEEVWQTAGESITNLRSGNKPVFLLARCIHIEGHFLGDPLIRLSRHPIKEGGKMAGPMIKALLKKKGASISEKTKVLKDIGGMAGEVIKKQDIKEQDPLFLTRQKLSVDKERLLNLENEISIEIEKIFTTVENKHSQEGGQA